MPKQIHTLMHQLYTVTCTFQYVVSALDETHAKQIAVDEVIPAFNEADHDTIKYQLQDGIHAEGWDDECYPYGCPWIWSIGEYRENVYDE